MWRKVRLVALTIMIAFSSVVARGQLVPELAKRRYRSPDGAYELTVDPSNRWGMGKGHNTLRHAGEIAYERDMPKTLWDARVTSSGRVFGYAFENGTTGGVRELTPDGKEIMQALFIYLIDASGETRAAVEMPRTNRGHGAFPEIPGMPYPSAITLDDANNRAMLWCMVTSDHQVDQTVYSLTDLTKIRTTRIKPKDRPPFGSMLMSARMIPDSPLVACEWMGAGPHCTYDEISVHDGEGNLICEREVSFAFEDERATERLIRERRSDELGVIELIPRGVRILKGVSQGAMKFAEVDGKWTIVAEALAPKDEKASNPKAVEPAGKP